MSFKFYIVGRHIPSLGLFTDDIFGRFVKVVLQTSPL